MDLVGAHLKLFQNSTPPALASDSPLFIVISIFKKYFYFIRTGDYHAK